MKLDKLASFVFVRGKLVTEPIDKPLSDYQGQNYSIEIITYRWKHVVIIC